MSNTKLIDRQDPIQGHDVRVKTFSGGNGADAKDDTAPLGNFTDIMLKIVNQTETFLPLFSKTPRYLDGEIIIVWSATAGVLSFDFVNQTFGAGFADAMKSGRTERIKRSNRFSLEFFIDTQEKGDNPSVFERDGKLAAVTSANKMVLKECRCDTLSFGVAAGKGYAVNSWQGTAEGLEVFKSQKLTPNE